MKIESLSEDFFCTGDIDTNNYCLEVFEQYVQKQKLDFFLEESIEIWEILKLLVIEFKKFEKLLQKLMQIMFLFIPRNTREEKKIKTFKKNFIKEIKMELKKVINSDYNNKSRVIKKILFKNFF